MALVREAISAREQEKQKGKSFNFCWIVFDKDDYQDFDEAIEFAGKNGFEVAYSNQAFELWFLLHFKKTHVNKKAEGLDLLLSYLIIYVFF